MLVVKPSSYLRWDDWGRISSILLELPGGMRDYLGVQAEEYSFAEAETRARIRAECSNTVVTVDHLTTADHSI